MINKYAEIRDRLVLYNACKGVLRVKMATIPDMRRASLLLAPLGASSVQELGGPYAHKRYYIDNSAPDSTTTSKTDPSIAGPTQQVQDGVDDTVGNNKNVLSERTKRRILRLGTLGACLGGTLYV